VKGSGAFLQKSAQKTFAPLAPGGCAARGPDLQKFFASSFKKEAPFLE
jgi:hypothetical protein